MMPDPRDVPRGSYTAKEVAQMLGKSVEYVRREVRAGRMRAVYRRDTARCYEIRGEEVARWLEEEFVEMCPAV